MMRRFRERVDASCFLVTEDAYLVCGAVGMKKMSGRKTAAHEKRSVEEKFLYQLLSRFLVLTVPGSRLRSFMPRIG